eukprot:jgi/Mesvir1/27809/Mv07490-RA.1
MLDPAQPMKEKDGVLNITDCSFAAFETLVGIIDPSRAVPIQRLAQHGVIHELVRTAVKYDMGVVIQYVYDEIKEPRPTSPFSNCVIGTWGVDVLHGRKKKFDLSTLEAAQKGVSASQGIKSHLSCFVSEFDLALTGSSYDQPMRFRWPIHVHLDLAAFVFLGAVTSTTSNSKVCIRPENFSSFRTQTVSDFFQTAEFTTQLGSSDTKLVSTLRFKPLKQIKAK